MSKNTAVEQFAAEVLKYKNPTNLNGTDYIMIPIDKLEYLKEQAKEIEKEQSINDFISGMEFIAVDPNRYKEDAEQYYNETYEQ